MSNREIQSFSNSTVNLKILFLDIDGVLNSEEFYLNEYNSGNKLSRFNPSSVDLIKDIVDEFSLKIVISSTWRYGAVDRLMQELKKNNLLEFLYPDWFTPVIHPAHRGTEIKLWLDMHPEVIEYLIIDDDENILEEQKGNFVKTSIHKGLRNEHLNRVRAIFSSVITIQE